MQTLPRIPEPELMDDAEEAEAYAAADFAATDQAMVERFLALFGAAGPRIIDLGCGPGNIGFRLAQQCPTAAVLGIDGAGAMLAVAERRRIADPLLADRLALQRAVLPLDAAALSALQALPERFAPPYHALVSNSLLHHLHDPQVLWRTLRQLGAPGAAVHIRDLRRPGSLAAIENLRARHLPADAPAVLARDYIASLHAAFTPAEVECQLRVAGLEALQVAPLDDRYLEVWGRLPS
ncbi:MAG: class I SAM-dependent methyltransferase [Prochlorococcaceae cyanobacterium]|jgi:trans-aconitate 2-methyltransferase